MESHRITRGLWACLPPAGLLLRSRGPEQHGERLWIDFFQYIVRKLTMSPALDGVFRKSDNIVFRKIDQEYLLVPLAASSGDVQSIYNLNETGAAVWERLDGRKTVSEIVEELLSEYEGQREDLEADVSAFLADLRETGIVEAV